MNGVPYFEEMPEFRVRGWREGGGRKETVNGDCEQNCDLLMLHSREALAKEDSSSLTALVLLLGWSTALLSSVLAIP